MSYLLGIGILFRCFYLAILTEKLIGNSETSLRNPLLLETRFNTT